MRVRLLDYLIDIQLCNRIENTYNPLLYMAVWPTIRMVIETGLHNDPILRIDVSHKYREA